MKRKSDHLTVEFGFTLEREDCEIDVAATATQHGSYRAATRWEPEEWPELEVTSLLVEELYRDGLPVSDAYGFKVGEEVEVSRLTEDELEDLELRASEKVEDYVQRQEEDAADWAYEAWKEATYKRSVK